MNLGITFFEQSDLVKNYLYIMVVYSYFLDYSDTWLMTNGHVFDIWFGGEAKHVYGASQKVQMIDEWRTSNVAKVKWRSRFHMLCF